MKEADGLDFLIFLPLQSELEHFFGEKTMAVKTTKAETVRQILDKIGAVSETPPDNWKVKAETELKKRKVKVHQTQIYEIRRKEMEKAGMTRPSRGKNAKATVTASVGIRRKRRKNSKVEELNFASALKIKSFAYQFGGLSKLRNHVEKIMELTGELK